MRGWLAAAHAFPGRLGRRVDPAHQFGGGELAGSDDRIEEAVGEAGAAGREARPGDLAFRPHADQAEQGFARGGQHRLQHGQVGVTVDHGGDLDDGGELRAARHDGLERRPGRSGGEIVEGDDQDFAGPIRLRLDRTGQAAAQLHVEQRAAGQGLAENAEALLVREVALSSLFRAAHGEQDGRARGLDRPAGLDPARIHADLVEAHFGDLTGAAALAGEVFQAGAGGDRPDDAGRASADFQAMSDDAVHPSQGRHSPPGRQTKIRPKYLAIRGIS